VIVHQSALRVELWRKLHCFKDQDSSLLCVVDLRFFSIFEIFLYAVTFRYVLARFASFKDDVLRFFL
jgi:hypothetical protein